MSSSNITSSNPTGNINLENTAIRINTYDYFIDIINQNNLDLLNDIKLDINPKSNRFFWLLHREIYTLYTEAIKRIKELNNTELIYLENGNTTNINNLLNHKPFILNKKEIKNRYSYKELSTFLIYLLRIYNKSKNGIPIYTTIHEKTIKKLDLLLTLELAILAIDSNTFTKDTDLRFKTSESVTLLLRTTINEIFISILNNPTKIESTELITYASPLFSFIVLRTLRKPNGYLKDFIKIASFTKLMIYNIRLIIIGDLIIREYFNIITTSTEISKYIIKAYNKSSYSINILNDFYIWIMILEEIIYLEPSPYELRKLLKTPSEIKSYNIKEGKIKS